MTGAITEYIDVAQLVLYAFWIFFAGLIVYLQRENMREGYPLESEVAGRKGMELFAPPSPKTFQLHDGRAVVVPRPEESYELKATPVDGNAGAPLEPTGNPMADGVGPAAWVMREDVPELTLEGAPMIVPLSAEPTFSLATEDPDPIGAEVVAADGVVAGTIIECWVDRAEPQIRYFEVTLSGSERRVMLPLPFSRIVPHQTFAWMDLLFGEPKKGRIGARCTVHVRSITAAQFAGVPGIAQPDRITKREEERIGSYYAGGTLYATPARQEPFV
jgi:photosynthetic reaction center H subunit